jgi:hypothetical protein
LRFEISEGKRARSEDAGEGVTWVLDLREREGSGLRGLRGRVDMWTDLFGSREEEMAGEWLAREWG